MFNFNLHSLLDSLISQPVKQRTLYWHKPIYYALILLHLFIYALVAIFVRKKAKLSIGLCSQHKKQRYIRIAIVCLAVFISLGLMFFALANDMLMDYILIFGLVLLISLIALVFASRLVLATKIDDTGVCIKGCGEDFLRSFE